MTSKLPYKKIPKKIVKFCFKFLFLTKKLKERNQCYTPQTFSKVWWLETSKYTIFLILLKFQNLWNFINVFILKNYENIYLNVSYDFSKFDGLKKSRCDGS